MNNFNSNTILISNDVKTFQMFYRTVPVVNLVQICVVNVSGINELPETTYDISERLRV